MKDELVSFNHELISFDVADLTVEELERRLELTSFCGCCFSNCPVLQTCGTFT